MSSGFFDLLLISPSKKCGEFRYNLRKLLRLLLFHHSWRYWTHIFSVRILLIIKDGHACLSVHPDSQNFHSRQRKEVGHSLLLLLLLHTPPSLKSTLRQHLTTPTQILLSNIIILLLYGKGNRWGLPLDFISNCCYIEITQKRNKWRLNRRHTTIFFNIINGTTKRMLKKPSILNQVYPIGISFRQNGFPVPKQIYNYI